MAEYFERVTPITTVVEFYNKSVKNNKASLLKIYPDAFRINRFRFSFANCDASMKRVPNGSVDFYLEVEKALVLAEDILSRQLKNDVANEAVERRKRSEKDGKEYKYAMPVRSYPGGLNARKAKEKKIRTDGMAQARVLKIAGASSDKLDIIISCECGPGRETKEGLIVPTYEYKPDTIVRVGMTWEQAKQLAVMLKSHYDAYLSSCYTYDEFAYQKFLRERNNG